jgi:hypothetical protein
LLHQEGFCCTREGEGPRLFIADCGWRQLANSVKRTLAITAPRHPLHPSNCLAPTDSRAVEISRRNARSASRSFILLRVKDRSIIPTDGFAAKIRCKSHALRSLHYRSKPAKTTLLPEESIVPSFVSVDRLRSKLASVGCTPVQGLLWERESCTVALDEGVGTSIHPIDFISP